MDKLTFTMENYLEAIYELSSDKEGARVSDIAKRLGVSKASTNSAIVSLAEKGLINYEKYKEIFLTEKGLELAKSTSDKHRIIKKFFVDILKIDREIADKDACSIEHVISRDSVIAMEKYMKGHKEKDGKNTNI
ncbi:metal-dependent transcriptional regulator [Anaerocolumna sp. AGMB13020]|uniref:metal-dependent transcriptional regulator n=1 Tax=Anaerocolumna sp. AGMB13020 TaxID=3081750 RepID=UPI002954D051|nr:metal-dependent transcriptional regulator [Anaerocolumna sp. AGMB13020]WOO38029.1 metal-dependent transcriptional regulator [Anaerocolumna sp. AGMB13020]